MESGTVIRAVMNPDNNPYSWYEDGEAYGIAADIFKETARELNLPYEIIPVSTQEEYTDLVNSGGVDVWMDMDTCYEDETGAKYKITGPYMTTTMSVLRGRGASDRITQLVVNDDHIAIREVISEIWPNAEITVVDSLAKCKAMVVSGEADGALLMSYAAQKLSRDDVQNRLRVDIVPRASASLMMGVDANIDHRFYGLWEKTLATVTEQERPAYAGKKVLLVEDNALNAEIAMELLHSLGLTVDWAENGALGVKRFEASQVDEYFAIFMDMQMPVMDGVTATREIRGSGRLDRDIPIFAMTANAFAEDVVKCKEAGMNAHLAKPCKVDQLVASIADRGK